MIIRGFDKNDSVRCLSIYRYYVENTVITFEEETPDINEFEKRLIGIAEKFPFLVAVENGEVIGYAYLDAFNGRSAYRYTADLSLYLDKDQCHKGVGSLLYRELEGRAKQSGIKNIIAIITALNENSLRFHGKMGFQFVGELADVGYKFDQWLSVKYYHKRI